MTRINMYSDEALDRFEPFHGLPEGAIPAISVAAGSFVTMTAAPAYGDDLDDADPDKAADWFTVRFIGADATGTGIAVPTGWSQVVFRIQSGGRTDIKPDPPARTYLVVTERKAA